MKRIPIQFMTMMNNLVLSILEATCNLSAGFAQISTLIEAFWWRGQNVTSFGCRFPNHINTGTKTANLNDMPIFCKEHRPKLDGHDIWTIFFIHIFSNQEPQHLFISSNHGTYS